MTSIGPSYANQYYQLANQQQNAQASSSNAASPATLADVLVASDATTNNGNDNSAYLLDLSPEAQQYMNSTGIAAPTSASDASSDASAGSFALSTDQQNKLNSILKKYKDLPPTQDNYNKLQDDLKAAGLSPDQLKAEDQIRSFNVADLLIQDLNGTGLAFDPSQSASSTDEDSKASSYMQQILTTWQNMTGANSPTSAGSSSASDTTTTSGA